MLLHAVTCFTLGKGEVGGSIPLRGTIPESSPSMCDEFYMKARWRVIRCAMANLR